jgi:dTDP-4-amino-4,6-dideoxygalactose transaminase
MTAPRVPLVRPDLGDAEVEAAARVIRSRWVTQGPEVAAFEEEFARAVSARHAVAVSNCTVALELSLRALGIGPGDDVVTASHSFIATANAVLAAGARPVFADVAEDTLGLDPASVEAAITPRTKAILAVHQVGIPCAIEAILAIARRRGLRVIEDAACAIGSEVRIEGRFERVGRPHGDVACFSFHPRKVVTTGDGGMIATSDAELAKRLRLLRQHAMSIPDTVRHEATDVVIEEYLEPAWNYRLTDLQAAIGRPQLARLDGTIAERRRLAAVYVAALAANPVLAPPSEPSWLRANWQSFPCRIRPGRAEQLPVLRALLARGVAAKPGIMNAHEERAYADRSRWAIGPTGLGVSERLRREVVLLPLFHGMSPAEQDRVLEACRALEEACRAFEKDGRP